MLHTTKSPPPTPRDVKTKLAETSSGPETPPPAKRLKHTPEETKIAASDYHHANPDVTKTTKGPLDSNDVPQTPVNVVSRGSSTSPSDLSASSRDRMRERAMSPLTPHGRGVPPAPPSTPASDVNAFASIREGLSTPIPYAAVANADLLERKQQLLAEGAETPAPTRPNQPPRQNQGALTDDFSEWAVGGRYKLIRMLGRGSYGEVAQAQDLYQEQTDAYVAIKRIQSPFDQEVDAVRLFREIHILRKLRGHDCVIQLLDIIQPPSEDLNDFHDLYLVFEYVDTDLYKLIMSPQYLTTEHIQTFLYQMLTGLKFIHSASVIHRDMKPANILLNEDCSLKICDFGLARIVDSSSMMPSSKGAEKAPKSTKSKPPSFSLVKKATLTRQLTKHVVTRWYRAPELILIQPYTSAVDIWSLGCIMAELLSMQEGNVPGYQDRQPLFPGGTCYPLSGETSSLADERLDQLSVIFGVIGTPSKEALKEVGTANAYLQTLETKQPKKLKELYPAADPVALDLLKQMLEFDPKTRCTADEALDHEFFKGVRRKEMEKMAEEALIIPDFLNSDEIDLELLKRRTYEEVLWYRDQQDHENPVSSGDS